MRPGKVVLDYLLGPVKDLKSNPSPGRFGILPQIRKHSLWACLDSESMSLLTTCKHRERERSWGPVLGPTAVIQVNNLVGLVPCSSGGFLVFF